MVKYLISSKTALTMQNQPIHVYFDGASKSAHELKGSLGILKMLCVHLLDQISLDEYALKIIEILIAILERNMELFGCKILER